ncbi:transposase, partial [uncultured Microscilla sp.]|uniref:transposase n=1 Tax=uncultured Microscilla sp. TaxID=432653 RepID=UPI002613903C
ILQAIEGKIRLISVDEKTGIQALERQMVSYQGGQRIEAEYIRHGTTCLLAALEVGKGEVVHHMLSDTRKEEDYLAFIQGLVSKYAGEEQLIILADNLNTHMSASLVEWVAQEIGYEADLGTKRYKGILKSMESRKFFLEDPTHRIRFVYTPKHCSWLNPIENWFAKLQRQAINKESFESKQYLLEEIDKYIQYYNTYLVKPFKWKFKGFNKDKQWQGYNIKGT